MSRPRRRVFGPLFYSTLVVSVLLTICGEIVIHESAVRKLLRERAFWQEEQALIAELHADNSKVREMALAALLERRSKAVVPYLLEAAHDPRSEVRGMACRYLVETVADHDVVVPVLAAAASDKDEKVRAEAALAFGRLLAVLPPGGQLGQSPANSMRIIPVSAPANQGGRLISIPIKEMAPALRALSSKALRPLLKDRASPTRIAAADALGQLGPDPDAAADLIVAAGDPERDLQLAAARALLKINGANDPTAGRTLVALIASREPIGDRMIILELVKSASAGVQDQAMAALASLLTDADLMIHQDVIDCLVAAGPRARLALPAVERLLNDKDPRQRCMAAIAVARIEVKTSPRTLPILLKVIEDVAVMPEERHEILEIFRESNAADLVKATPILIRQLGSKNPNVRTAAMEMLGLIIGDTPAEMPGPISEK